jgi:hypothetical protein
VTAVMNHDHPMCLMLEGRLRSLSVERVNAHERMAADEEGVLNPIDLQWFQHTGTRYSSESSYKLLWFCMKCRHIRPQYTVCLTRNL